MKLKEWLKEKGVLPSHLSRDTGLHLSFLSRILDAKQNPSPYMTERIIAYTDGALTKEDICLYVKPVVHCPTCGHRVDHRKKAKKKAPAEKAVAEKDEV